MVNQQTLEGRWEELKGKLRQRWGQLRDEELQRHKGSAEQLVGMIQRKTGETRESVERFIDDVVTRGSSVFAQAAEQVRSYATQASGRAQKAPRAASGRLRAGLQQTEETVRRRPLGTLGVCLGAGLLAGLIMGLMCRSKR